MTGAGASKRHSQRRRAVVKARRDCNYRDSQGVWQPRAAWKTKRAAKRAIDRIYDATGRAYVRYECSGCGLYHIKPGRRTDPAQPC